jgi:hypothetical protein
MIFNGHTQQSLDALDSETMLHIQTMYADGLVGQHGLLNQLSQLAGIVYNYARSPSIPAMPQGKLLGLAADYLFPPPTEQDKKEQVNNQLLAFLSQAPGFSPKTFGIDHG